MDRKPPRILKDKQRLDTMLMFLEIAVYSIITLSLFFTRLKINSIIIGGFAVELLIDMCRTGCDVFEHLKTKKNINHDKERDELLQ